MELIEAVKTRHSVRDYLDKTIEAEAAEKLIRAAEECNRQSGLNIRLCLNQSRAFDTILALYGNLKSASNYFVLAAAPKTENAEELCGYYGQKLVLLAQQLGLNTCWVGGSYSKRKTRADIGAGEKLHLIIALGYGKTQGKERKTKPLSELYRFKGEGEPPAWFLAAMAAAALAPTAINQQKFLFTLNGETVSADAFPGSYAKVDLGIVKYNFEVGAEAAGAISGTDWRWA